MKTGDQMANDNKLLSDLDFMKIINVYNKIKIYHSKNRYTILLTTHYFFFIGNMCIYITQCKYRL